MHNTHKGSILGLKRDIILPVDFEDKLIPFYYHSCMRGDFPLTDISSITPDAKFGQVTAVESGTQNLWTAFVNGGAPTTYNNFSSGGISSSLYKLSETFMGEPIWRLEMTPLTDAGLTSLRNDFHSHGIYSNSLTYAANTAYCASLYWRPVTHQDTEVGGTASNIQGWINGISGKGLPVSTNGWRRSWAYRNQGATAQTDSSYWSFRSPSIQLNQKIIIDWSMGQIESGRTQATSFVAGSRSGGQIIYPKELVPTGDFTISVWISPNGEIKVASQNYKILSTGSDYLNTLFTLWNYYPISTDTQGADRRIILDVGGNDVGSRQAKDLISPDLFTVGKWELLTITFKRETKTFTVYRNGVLWNSPVAGKIHPIDDLRLHDSGWKYSNLLISPRIAEPQEIKMWYTFGKAFYDPYDYTAVFG